MGTALMQWDRRPRKSEKESQRSLSGHTQQRAREDSVSRGIGAPRARPRWKQTCQTVIGDLPASGRTRNRVLLFKPEIYGVWSRQPERTNSCLHQIDTMVSISSKKHSFHLHHFDIKVFITNDSFSTQDSCILFREN